MAVAALLVLLLLFLLCVLDGGSWLRDIGRSIGPECGVISMYVHTYIIASSHCNTIIYRSIIHPFQTPDATRTFAAAAAPLLPHPSMVVLPPPSTAAAAPSKGQRRPAAASSLPD